jgi:HAE1 family hydrophobic/amphiphilic exporter-1
MTITELSIKRPLLITVAFLALILFGIISYLGLNYDLLPKFEVGVISVTTPYPGASPEDVESNLTKPIEDAVSTIEGLDIITSKSMENASSVILQLKSGVNDIIAQQDVERKINQIKSTLPTGAYDPVVNRFSSDQFPVLNLTVSAKISEAELYTLIEKNILPELTNVNGVGQISLIGGEPREIEVALDNGKLNANRISAAQVYQLLSDNSTAFPAGDITSDEQKMLIRLDAGFSDVETIGDVVLRQNANGSRLLLKEVAIVNDGIAATVTINRINGKQGIGLQVYKTNDANSVDVSKGVQLRLQEIREEYASRGFDYEIASDQSVYTLTAANAVVEDLMLAVLIVGFVMLMFLHSLRSSLFVLVAIPSAMIPTFICMAIFGFSLNMMTLMALSMVVGILVDDSIVVLENIYRHFEMGKSKVQAAIDGRSEIGFTAIAITLVDIVVFLPMAFTGGLIGNIVRQFALVVVFSTLMSLMVSFTLTPLLASRFGKLEQPNRESLWGKISLGFESFLDSIKDLYSELLGWSLGHKRYILALVVLLIAGSVALIPAGFIGSSFLGTGDRGQLSIKLEMSPDLPLHQTNLLVKRAESIVLQHPEVENVYTLVGTQTGVAGSVSNSNIAEMNVTLSDKRMRKITTDNFGVLARNEIEKIPGIQAAVLPVTITGSTNSAIQIVISSPEIDSVNKAAGLIRQIVMNTPGTDYVRLSTKTPKKQVRISPNRQKTAEAGFTIKEVASAVNLAFSGNDKLNLKEGGEDYSINIVLGNSDKQKLADVNNLTLINRLGKPVQLSQVARVEEVLVPSVLERNNRLSSITITSSAVGRPSGTIVEDIKKSLSETKLPASTNVEYRGDSKNQKEAFSSLAFALIIAIILVYLIMVALYESLIYPFVVIFSVPVATIGALLAIALTMNQLTIFTIVGIIMLLGLVTKNGILIVDFANHLKEKGVPVVEALMEAGKERLRPIMMTTFAMILGMLPLALSKSPGSEFKNGMAWVLIGGLTSSFLFTLILVPIVYLIVEQIKDRFASRGTRHQKG